jgi:hypothetical protein
MCNIRSEKLVVLMILYFNYKLNTPSIALCVGHMLTRINQMSLVRHKPYIRRHSQSLSPLTVPYGQVEYGLEVLKQQFRYFRSFLVSTKKLYLQKPLQLFYVSCKRSHSHAQPLFRGLLGERFVREIRLSREIMMMDWRDRPTTKELLEDGWFMEDEMSSRLDHD